MVLFNLVVILVFGLIFGRLGFMGVENPLEETLFLTDIRICLRLT